MTPKQRKAAAPTQLDTSPTLRLMKLLAKEVRSRNGKMNQLTQVTSFMRAMNGLHTCQN